jgi:hypothetical protein
MIHLSLALGYTIKLTTFKFSPEIHKDTHNSGCTTGANDTGNKLLMLSIYDF